MDTSTKQYSIRFGIILAIMLFLISLIGVCIDVNFILNRYADFTTIITVVLIGVLTVAYSKKLKGGFINFKECFSSYFLMLSIAIVLSGAANYVYFNFINTNFQIEFKKEIVVKFEERKSDVLNDKKWTDDEKEKEIAEINKAIDYLKNEKNNMYNLKSTFKTSIFSLAFLSVFGILISFLLKTTENKK